MHELPKKEKDMKLCEACRDIALASEAGKVYRGILRTHFVPQYWRFCSEAQYGGVRHRGCDFGNLGGRSFDAITAFAAMHRALVCHQCLLDHPTADALMASGFSADEVACLARRCMLLRAKRCCSHHTFAGFCPILCPARGRLRRECRIVAATRCGSKAGEPLADLAFGMLMRRFLQRVRDRMNDLGLVARLLVYGAALCACRRCSS